MAGQVFQVEKVVAGGEGLVRDRRQVIFVPFVIPGEEIRIEVLAGSRRPVRAKLREVVRPSADRVEPVCPQYMSCGGCQFQHIAYGRQLRLKEEILAESLSRIARLRVELGGIIPSPGPYYYRSRLKLQVRAGRVGFFGMDSHTLVPVEFCYLAGEPINAALGRLLGLVSVERPRTVELIVEPGGGILARLEGGRKEKVFRRRGEEWEAVDSPRLAFQQVNPAQNENLKRLVAEVAAQIQPEGVFELYAGAGNLTQELIPHCGWLVAVESDPSAVEIAQDHFSFVSPSPVNFVRQRAEDFLASEWARRMRPELVVLDPPRTGAPQVVSHLVRILPAHILYVSCDPASLARDLQPLLAAGYRVHALQPLDMFPQTAHIETVVWLARD